MCLYTVARRIRILTNDVLYTAVYRKYLLSGTKNLYFSYSRYAQASAKQLWAAQKTSIKVTVAWSTDKIKVVHVLYGAIYRKCLLSSTKIRISEVHDMHKLLQIQWIHNEGELLKRSIIRVLPHTCLLSMSSSNFTSFSWSHHSLATCF